MLVLTIIAGLLNIIDDISFTGQWTTRGILIGVLLSGILMYPFSDWIGKAKFEKNYFRLFSFLPVLTAGFLMIPFLGVVVGFSFFFRLTEPVDKIYFEDNKLRVQSTFTGVLAPPRLDVIEKKGRFEFRLNKSHRSAAGIDSISVDQRTDKTFVILYNEQEMLDTVKAKKS